MLFRNPKLGGVDVRDPADGKDALGGYKSAVDEVARLRATYADRNPDCEPFSGYPGDSDEDELQAGIARSLADVRRVETNGLNFGDVRPRGLVDVLRSVAHDLAGRRDGGDALPPLR